MSLRRRVNIFPVFLFLNKTACDRPDSGVISIAGLLYSACHPSALINMLVFSIKERQPHTSKKKTVRRDQITSVSVKRKPASGVPVCCLHRPTVAVTQIPVLILEHKETATDRGRALILSEFYSAMIKYR